MSMLVLTGFKHCSLWIAMSEGTSTRFGVPSMFGHIQVMRWTCADWGHGVVEAVSLRNPVHGLQTSVDPRQMVIPTEVNFDPITVLSFLLTKWEAWCCSLIYGFNPCSSRSFPPQRPCGQMQRLKTRSLNFWRFGALSMFVSASCEAYTDTLKLEHRCLDIWMDCQ